MAEFSCTKVTTGSVTLVRPTGYLDDTGGRSLRQAFEDSLQQGGRRFILNLATTPVINSQGVTQILELVESILYDHKGTLALVGLSELYADVFHVIGILKLVKSYPDEAAALKELQGP